MPSARSQRRSRPARKAGYSMQARKAKSSMPSSDYTSDTDQSDGEEGGYSCNGRKLRRTRGYYDLTNESESEDCYSRGRRASDKRKREGGHRSPRGRRPRATSNGHGVEQEDSSRDESKAVLKRGWVSTCTIALIQPRRHQRSLRRVSRSSGATICRPRYPPVRPPPSRVPCLQGDRVRGKQNRVEPRTQLGVWYQRETATRGKLSQAATTSLDKAKNIQVHRFLHC